MDLTACYPIVETTRFSEETAAAKYHRYKSWDHSYLFFKQYRAAAPEQKAEQLDLASMHLYCFLASWGMVRGSSELLQKDYKFCGPLVQVLVKPKYAVLWEFDTSSSARDATRIQKATDALFTAGIVAELESILTKGRVSPTPTLITKILLGTCCCIPAYDDFAKYAMRKGDGLSCPFGRQSYKKLFAFYDKHAGEFDAARVGPSEWYPPMRMLDMYLWEAGKRI